MAGEATIGQQRIGLASQVILGGQQAEDQEGQGVHGRVAQPVWGILGGGGVSNWAGPRSLGFWGLSGGSAPAISNTLAQSPCDHSSGEFFSGPGTLQYSYKAKRKVQGGPRPDAGHDASADHHPLFFNNGGS